MCFRLPPSFTETTLEGYRDVSILGGFSILGGSSPFVESLPPTGLAKSLLCQGLSDVGSCCTMRCADLLVIAIVISSHHTRITCIDSGSIIPSLDVFVYGEFQVGWARGGIGS